LIPKYSKNATARAYAIPINGDSPSMSMMDAPIRMKSRFSNCNEREPVEFDKKLCQNSEP